jgi:acetylornithine deacetylase/succinyl-diaminopimelate desuccinylase family protein
MSDFNTPAEKALSELISIPSVSGSEGLIKGLVEKEFISMGLDVSLQHVDNDRYNIIGKIGEGPLKLMFCTHLDVIPALDDQKWSTPPFKAVKSGDRIYGRGSTDAKGSLAAMMEAFYRVKKSGKKLNGLVAIGAVIEEETGKSVGAKRLLEEYRPQMAVIGEPTDMEAAIAHKGAIRPVITVHGKAAHASSPKRGINAIALMGHIVEYLESYGYKVEKNSDDILGKSSLEITMIRGGERINVIPEKCSIHLDRRLVSNETVDDAYKGIKKVIGRASKKIKRKVDIELLCAYPPSRTDTGEDIVRHALEVLKKNGMNHNPVGFPAGSDMWVFRSYGIPTIIMGPGQLSQAHVIDEYIRTDDLNRAVDIYEDLIYSILA